MKLSRLLQRELDGVSKNTSVPAFYGDKAWVDDLDIVNELGGHSGCVNALSWSRSGRLLASGSDDRYLNIHAHQPDSSTAPFSLTTSISTGHSENIFSTKFMPHSEDRTLVTCAGDGEVRIFDIEYSGRSTTPSDLPASSQRGRLHNVFDGVRYLSEADTNARVYRSHSDRVKRIVTESSPYLFLTCSEDGEVRQWDLRQPSSAYPSPRGGRGFLAARGADHDDSNVPPPLISYKRCRLDLNTISCSASQPHYIALGGAHLHCFLHDRRMLGRDTTLERGSPSFQTDTLGQDPLHGQATRCVRRFAPNGATKMKRNDNNHITACKISDANPNEMVVSWSGDWIYSFDLVNGPDATEPEGSKADGMSLGKSRTKESRDRKRKRRLTTSKSPDKERGGSKPRQTAADETTEGDLALRVRYENGQSEEIPIESPRPEMAGSDRSISEARDAVLTEAQRKSHRIAQAVVKVRKELFGLESTRHASEPTPSGDDPTNHTTSFSNVLSHAAAYIQDMDEIMRTWRYPVNPLEEDVIFQQTLRRNREAARHFVQAAGTTARVLGGRLRTGGGGESPILHYFQQITPGDNDRNLMTSAVTFGYDFSRAILAWLDGGCENLLQAFLQTPERRKHHPRYPVPHDAGPNAIDEFIISYLLHLAGGRSIPNVDASIFDRDEYQISFETETSAVVAFSNAIKIPFRSVEASAEVIGVTVPAQYQDRRTALRFWGLKVVRGLLMNAAEGVNYAFVDRAFGGLGIVAMEDGTSQETSNRHEVSAAHGDWNMTNGELESPPPYSAGSTNIEEANWNEELMLLDDLHNEIADRLESGVNDDEDDTDTDDDDDDDGDVTNEDRQFLWASAFDRTRSREKVEQGVPCASHTRQYRGHCNIKTVKDVNFYGLQDEYVVSGSDSGHLFIWDKKTTQLINILEGDGEVVNVVQGHPYEPMLAVSGIDHTIKIFSPDRQAQDDARKGVNLARRSSTGYSSLELGGRRHLGRRRPRRPARPDRPLRSDQEDDEDEGNDEDDVDRGGEDAEELATAPNGLKSRKRMHRSYEITSQNDVERQGGMRDAYITRGMLAQLAARLRERQAVVDGNTGAGGEVTGLVMDDNCSIM